MLMANLIATEGYAYSIGGSGSYVNNRGCTKSRATQLNCSVSGSYSNNQLVPQSALSRASSGGGSSGWTTTSSYSISGYTIYKSYGKEGVANSDTTQQFYWSSGTTVYIGSSSESNYDTVYITNSSGSQVGSAISGSHAPSSLSNMTSVSISSSGYYTVHYKKDGSVNSGNDCGYLAVPNGGSSGGDSGGSSGSYYAYYYVDNSQKYYRTTSSQTRSKSDWSGASSYNYQGYIYYDTLSQALNQYNGSASSCDSTSSTYSGSSTVVVFFFTSSSGGGSSGGDSGGDSGGGSGGGNEDGTYYIRNLSVSGPTSGTGPVTLSSSFTVPTSVPSYVCDAPSIVVTGWWIDFDFDVYDRYGDWIGDGWQYGRIVSESGGGAGNVYSCTKRWTFPDNYTWRFDSASGGITYHPA